MDNPLDRIAPFPRWLAETIIIAGLIYATGKCGHLMTIPPGNVTVLWPPAGLSLAFLTIVGNRSLARIFLGAVLINLFVYVDQINISVQLLTMLAVLMIGLRYSLHSVAGCIILIGGDYEQKMVDS